MCPYTYYWVVLGNQLSHRSICKFISSLAAAPDWLITHSWGSLLDCFTSAIIQCHIFLSIFLPM